MRDGALTSGPRRPPPVPLAATIGLAFVALAADAVATAPDSTQPAIGYALAAAAALLAADAALRAPAPIRARRPRVLRAAAVIVAASQLLILALALLPLTPEKRTQAQSWPLAILALGGIFGWVLGIGAWRLVTGHARQPLGQPAAPLPPATVPAVPPPQSTLTQAHWTRRTHLRARAKRLLLAIDHWHMQHSIRPNPQPWLEFSDPDHVKLTEAQNWGLATWLVPFTAAGQEVKLLVLNVAPPDPGRTDRLLLTVARRPWVPASGLLVVIAATALLASPWASCAIALLTFALAAIVLVPAAGRLRGGQLESLPADADFALRRLHATPAAPRPPAKRISPSGTHSPTKTRDEFLRQPQAARLRPRARSQRGRRSWPLSAVSC